MDVGLIILAVSSLCTIGIIAGAAGQKIDAPILLIFLLVGMLAGREGPGGINIDASQSAIVWASAALAAILYEGGLRTKFTVFRLGAPAGLTLAIGGTISTAFLVAPVAYWLFGLSWTEALLVGAIVSATDAAAVFALAATGLKMPDRVAAILEVESGNNDPIAILLVVGLSTTLAGTVLSPLDWGVMFVQKLTLGAATGLLIGAATPYVLQRTGLQGSLRSILAAALGFVAFGLAETLGGSGFLAIYLAGLSFAARAPKEAERSAALFDGFAWLAQTGLFLMLGLLITPSHLSSVALPALGLALALIALARPVAVFVSLLPFKLRPREMTFVSWVGLRGATPVFLGLIPAAMGVPNGNLYLSIAAMVVLLSLVIQGWTAPVVGRALNLSGEVAAPIDRGETIARLSAVTCLVGVGTWFAVSLGPSTQLILVEPETPTELQAALQNELQAPATFPPEFFELPLDERRALFIATVSDVMARANQTAIDDLAKVKALRARLVAGERLTLTEDAELDAIARRYDLPLTSVDELARRIGPVPVRLAVAQAAVATGWGGAQRALENNAVFGLNLQAGYSDLESSAKGLVVMYASHPEFADFRKQRAQALSVDDVLTAETLANYIGPFAADADTYVESVLAVLRGLPDE